MADGPRREPIALTIAGSDPSGGAGIQADLKTFTALGVYGASVITALTAQNTRGVTGVHGVPQAFIAEQIETLVSDLQVTAVKTGMLGDRQTVATVVAALKCYDFGAVVVDPVMVATSGDVLLAEDAIAAVRHDLIPLATLVTPNLHEAARLLDGPLARTKAAGCWPREPAPF
jgi:hydroxymethylpyrimidine/phosphomethylpyrimidine kinase